MKARIFSMMFSIMVLFSIPAQAAARFTPAPSVAPTSSPYPVYDINNNSIEGEWFCFSGYLSIPVPVERNGDLFQTKGGSFSFSDYDYDDNGKLYVLLVPENGNKEDAEKAEIYFCHDNSIILIFEDFYDDNKLYRDILIFQLRSENIYDMRYLSFSGMKRILFYNGHEYNPNTQKTENQKEYFVQGSSFFEIIGNTYEKTILVPCNDDMFVQAKSITYNHNQLECKFFIRSDVFGL